MIELFLTIIPAWLIFVVVRITNLQDQTDLLPIIGVLVPSAFVVFSFYIPRAIDKVVQTHSRQYQIRKESGSVSPAGESYLIKHAKLSRIILRSTILTILLMFYPLVILFVESLPAESLPNLEFIDQNISDKNILIPDLYFGSGEEIIDSIFLPITILLGFNISLIILNLSLHYYERSQITAKNSFLETNKAGILLIIIIIGLFAMFSRVTDHMAAIGFGLVMVCSLFIVIYLHIF